MSDNRIFDFESDFGGDLHCIPMCVRLMLDLTGIKLSLKQWNRFSQETRRTLVQLECEAAIDISAYRAYLVDRITAETFTMIDFAETGGLSEWQNRSVVPARLIAYARSLGISPPSIHQWTELSDLQRFTLFKLTRPDHDNDNFVPAMTEFSLIS
jgi:hypothetical protein